MEVKTGTFFLQKKEKGRRKTLPCEQHWENEHGMVAISHCSLCSAT